MDAEFKLRGWSKMYNGPSGMRPITLGNKVAQLKESLLEGAVVIQLRDSIEYNRSIVDGVLFPQSLAILCILHMENRVNEKIIMMLILEGMRKRSQPVVLEDYFKRLVELFNNGVMHDKDGQWKLPMKDGKLEPVSLSNTKARKIVQNIELLFDLVFQRHLPECQRRHMFKDCIMEKFRDVIVGLRQKSDFSNDEIIRIQRKID